MDYRKAFHQEVYALMRDAFEESFTPGSDTVKAPSEPVMLKPDFYKLMANIACATLERRGLKPPSDFSIEAESKKIFTLSGGDIEWKQNPSTPRVPPELYDRVPFFEKFFSRSLKNPAPAEKKSGLFNEFRSTHTHLAMLYLRVACGLKDSDFANDEKPAGTSKLSEDAQKKPLLNQYRRYTQSMILLSVIKLAYEITPSEIDEIMDRIGVMKLNSSQLKASRNRAGYQEHLAQLMAQVFGGQRLGVGILGKLKKRLA